MWLEKWGAALRVANDKLVYGIRTLSVYSNRLRSIIEPCAKAKVSEDARDKYFLELVAEVDFSSGVDLHDASELVKNNSLLLTKYLSDLEEISPSLDLCLREKMGNRERVSALAAKFTDLSRSQEVIGM